MEELLRADGASRSRPWLGDLARLEWALLDVFDEADATPLSFDDVRAISPSALGTLRIALVPATRVLDVEFEVDLLWRALHEEGKWVEPRRATRSVLAFRNDVTVRHRTLDDVEASVLRLAGSCGGVLFADVCDRLGKDRSVEEAAALATSLLAQWIADGIVRAVTTRHVTFPCEGPSPSRREFRWGPSRAL